MVYVVALYGDYLRGLILQLAEIAEKDRGAEVPFDICLFERHNLTAEEVRDSEWLLRAQD